jgi:molecular chaperone Hsp33
MVFWIAVMTEQSETFQDQPLRFSIPTRHARGRVLRLDAVLNDILSAHKYPPLVERTLAEALVLTALLGSSLKDVGGQLTMQAQTENGPIGLLACDYRDGALRGYAQYDADRIAMLGPNTTLFGLFGKGYLAITFDREPQEGQEKGSRYQGIVPLEGNSLSEAAEHYFVQSEQIPTLIRVAIGHTGGRCVAGGIILQHLADGEEGRERLHVKLDHPEWEHIAIMGGTIKPDELMALDLTLEQIIWRLFHEETEVRIDRGGPFTKGCRCDIDHIREVIARFPYSERKEMADDDGIIIVDCKFCSRDFPISLASLNN